MTADIIAKIDAVTGCHQCGATLAGSPSDDFCSEPCQHRWASDRVGAQNAHITVSPVAEFVVMGEAQREAVQRSMQSITVSMRDLVMPAVEQMRASLVQVSSSFAELVEAARETERLDREAEQ